MTAQPEFYLVSPCDGIDWLDDEVHPVSPVPAVRRHLGGRWERKKEFQPGVVAYFNGARRVLVMRFPAGTTAELAQAILGNIRENREDRS